jgi:hypothetical protein
MLLNVRLGEKEERAVRGLRRAKVNVSALVRRALVTAAQEHEAQDRSPVEILDRILAEIPGPTTKLKRPRLDDRRAMSAYIRKRLERR